MHAEVDAPETRYMECVYAFSAVRPLRGLPEKVVMTCCASSRMREHPRHEGAPQTNVRLDGAVHFTWATSS